jgi:SAM-dependent methyltransferase
MPRCSVCQQSVDRWLPHPHIGLRSDFIRTIDMVGSDLTVYQCPACRCTDRDRHLWLYLQAAGLQQAIAGARVLHIAPEWHLERLIEALGPSRYVRGDLNPTRAGHLQIDVEHLPFADAEFDMIICNHVLEHVADPARALAEFHRCIAPPGVLIAQTPYAARLRTTFEVEGPVSPQFARQFFDQDDHVRLFGGDIERYFRTAGFEGRLLRHDSLLPGVDPFDSGCNAHEPLFAFWKPAAPAAESAAA